MRSHRPLLLIATLLVGCGGENLPPLDGVGEFAPCGIDPDFACEAPCDRVLSLPAMPDPRISVDASDTCEAATPSASYTRTCDEAVITIDEHRGCCAWNLHGEETAFLWYECGE